MADFYLLPTTGFSLAQWLDPARPPATLAPSDPGAPSRLNARLQAPHTRWRCTVGTACTVEAILDGQSEPVDDGHALFGRVFSAWWAEWPEPLVTLTVNVAIISFTPAAPGYYLLAVERYRGGIALCHFDAEDP